MPINLGNAIGQIAVVLEQPVDDQVFAALEQLLGQVERAKEGMVPATTVLREVRAIARDGDIQDRQSPHRFLMSAGECEGRRPAPVMADEVEAFDLQMVVHQASDIGRHCPLVLSRGRAPGVTQTAQIGRNHTEAAGQVRDDATPLVGSLRNAVQQHHWRSVARTQLVDDAIAEIGIFLRMSVMPSCQFGAEFVVRRHGRVIQGTQTARGGAEEGQISRMRERRWKS